MPAVLAFDVYGTLIDTAGVVSKLRGLVGDQAEAFSALWREKQLEYSFRRGLMQRYEIFPVCVRDSLDYTSDYLGAALTDDDKQSLLDTFKVLPAFDDAAESLDDLRSRGFALYAFSNGTADAVDTLLSAAGIRDRFLDVVSVDEVQTFKPSPAVYRHFLSRSGAEARDVWLISGNPFDVIGGMSAGMRGAWVKRSDDALFDPWRIEPTITIGSLRELGDRIAGHDSTARMDAERLRADLDAVVDQSSDG